MSEIRKADPMARRQAVLLVAVAAIIGTFLILTIEQNRDFLRHWLLVEFGRSPERVYLAMPLIGALFWAPLVGLAVYLWWLGRRVLEAREFPPPGLRVIRDTRVITGDAAISRGRRLILAALGCGGIAFFLGVLLWRLARLLAGHA